MAGVVPQPHWEVRALKVTFPTCNKSKLQGQLKEKGLVHTGRQTRPPTGISQLPDLTQGTSVLPRHLSVDGGPGPDGRRRLRARDRVSPWLPSPSCPQGGWFPWLHHRGH